ncbi:MAG: hypothetical protein H0V71_12890 [Chloroflexi bacterium]|nr:hypothetical protein [Chloroflexota bacterium]
MIALDHHVLELGVRWLHVASMALMLGGALLLWMSLRAPLTSEAAPLRAATTYEGAFWAAAGLIVLTGVGNIAAFGRALLPAETGWGVAFLWKLLVIVGLLGASVVRSLAVAQLASRASETRSMPATVSPTRAIARLYGVTAGAIALAVALAVVMAHGT